VKALALVFFDRGAVRTIAYIDGFNLYFGSVRGTPHKWLNLRRLLELHLHPHNQIVGIKYFTAKISPRPNDLDAPVRQETFLRALKTLPGVEIKYGHFLTKNVRMLLANPAPGQPATVMVVKTEEKGSDVNLAVQLVHDAHLDRFDCAVIVSGDSDLLMPVTVVRNEIGKMVGVLNPQRHPCAVLKANASFYKHLRPNFVAAAQFPNTLADARGTFSKPAVW
jgi:uncharacterized LabA/DUF88 family protein